MSCTSVKLATLPSSSAITSASTVTVSADFGLSCRCLGGKSFQFKFGRQRCLPTSLRIALRRDAMVQESRSD